MSEPSARWTAETERRALDAMFPGLPREMPLDEARRRIRAVLTALADAGLLLPPGGETREEFRVVYNHRLGHPVIWSAGPWTRCEDAEASRQKAIAVGYADAAIQKRTIGPWVPVNDGGR